MSAPSQPSSAAWPWPDSFDAVIGPGETVPLHTHRRPAVLHLTGWSDCMRRDAAGWVLVDTRGRPASGPRPRTIWSEPHPPERVGPVGLRVPGVELKRSSSLAGRLRAGGGSR